MHYPSWRYHKSQAPRVVQNEEEDLSLGVEWADSPAKFQCPEGETYREHMEEWKAQNEDKPELPKRKRGKA